MTRKPMNLPLDQMTQREIDNGSLASYVELAEIDAKQHSLATGYYGAPVWYYIGSLESTGGVAKTAYVHYNVPPQVTRVGFVVSGVGNGAVHITTETEAGVAIDSVGTRQIFKTSNDGGGPLQAVFKAMDNNTPGATVDDARTVTVATVASWEWQTAVAKIEVLGFYVTVGGAVVADYPGKVYGVAVVPLHVMA